MADLSNSKIKDTYQFVLQADGSGNLQTLLGASPNPLIINNNLRYVDGNQQSGYVLKSDGNGNASWGEVSTGDLYISAATLDNTVLKLETTSGSTISVPVSYWSSDGLGNYSNSGLTGNVGIGTSTPNKKLTVVGTISGTSDVYANRYVYSSRYYVNDQIGLSYHAASSTYRLFNIDDSTIGIGAFANQNSRIKLWGNVRASGRLISTGLTSTIGPIISGTTDLNDLFVKTSDLNYGADDFWSGETGNTVFPISPTNTKLGIGTSTPGHTLQVAGTISGTSDMYLGGTLDIAPNNWLKIGGNNMTYFQGTQAFFYQDVKLYDSKKLLLGIDGDMELFHNGSNGFIDNNTGYLWIKSPTLYLGDNTSEVTVQDNLTVEDILKVNEKATVAQDLTVGNLNNEGVLYVDSTNKMVGVRTLQPDALLTLSGESAGFEVYDLNGGTFTASNGFTRVSFSSGASTAGLGVGCQLRFNDADSVETVTIDSITNDTNAILTETYEGETVDVSQDDLLINCGETNVLMKAYEKGSITFQLSGSSIYSGTTNLLDIFAKTSDIAYPTNLFWSGNTAGSLFPISPTNTKVGIGTHTPVQTLEVDGSVSASTTVSVGNNLIVGNDISANKITLNAASGNAVTVNSNILIDTNDKKIGFGRNNATISGNDSKLTLESNDVFVNAPDLNVLGRIHSSGLTATGDVEISDAGKLKLGDGGDLEIYHDSNNSYIDDAGTGTIFYRSGTQTFQNAAGSKTMAVFNAANSVDLSYNNSEKFSTTNTGIKVIGDAAVHNLNVKDDIIHSGDTNNKIAFGTDVQDFQTGGSSRLDISDSGVRLGGSGARVTTIENNDALGTSDTKLPTQGNVKAYVDGTYNRTYISYFSSVSASLAATNNWILPSVGGGISNHTWNVNSTYAGSNQSVGDTFTVAANGGVQAIPVPFDGILEGFYCNCRNNGGESSPRNAALFTSTLDWGTSNANTMTLRFFGAGDDDGGTSNSKPYFINGIGEPLAVSRGDVIMPAVSAQDGGSIAFQCTWTVVLATTLSGTT